MMHRTLMKCALKVGIGLLFLGMVAVTFTGHAAFAAGPCAGDATTFTDNCSVHLSTFFPAGELVFTSDADATMPTGGSANGSNDFSFSSQVFDDRGVIDGWTLEASSAGLVSPGVTSPAIPLTITGITPGAAVGASCGTTGPVFDGGVTTPLDTTPSPYVSLTPTVPLHCADSFTTLGNYAIPANSPAGDYVGDITLTLVATAGL